MVLRIALVCLVAAIVSAGQRPTFAAERVDVAVGKNSPQLERFAAGELAAQFERLFDASPQVVDALDHSNAPLVIIGSPDTNSLAARFAGGKWPKTTDQTIVLQSFSAEGRQGLIVGGGSPAATLWAVYELGHRLGVRYLLRDDVFPRDKAPLKLAGFNVVMTPELRTRAWRTVGDLAIGPESWGLADQKRLLGQLAKLKFNRVIISLQPWQPFVHYEFGGVKKQSALLWYGERYEIAADAPGRTAMGGAATFDNPDFVGKTSYTERIETGTKLVWGIIDEAHRLGMSAGISISPLEFPREFAAALPGAEAAGGLNGLTIRPGAKNRPNDPALVQLIKSKIGAYLKTYPQVDAIYLSLPGFPEWSANAEAAWEQLSGGRDVGGLTLEQLVQSARQRKLETTGDRGEQAVKGDIVGLALLKGVLADLRRQPEHEPLQIVVSGVDPALHPVLDRVLPAGAGSLNFANDTARRVAENRELLAGVPAERISSSLTMTLADDQVGVLSQSAVRSIDQLAGEIRKLGWDGFATRYWMLAEIDPAVHYLSRASWDKSVTARSAHDDLFTAMTGKQSVADRMWLAMGHIEDATNLVDKNAYGLAYPSRDMFMKHYRAEPLPPWWDDMIQSYTQAMIELYRSHDAAAPHSRKLLYYYAKRSEYVLEYLTAVKALRESAIARQNGDSDAAIEQLDTAVESLYNCIDTLGDVARDQSDRGLIAVLNAYAFAPLMQEYDKLAEE